MVRYPPKRRPCTKMWKHTNFFVLIMVFMMVSQPAFAMDYNNRETFQMDDEFSTADRFEMMKEDPDNNCKIAIDNMIAKTFKKFTDEPNKKNKDEYLVALDGLKEIPRECSDVQFQKIKQKMRCEAGIGEVIIPVINKNHDVKILAIKQLNRPDECGEEQFKKIKQEVIDAFNDQKLQALTQNIYSKLSNQSYSDRHKELKERIEDILKLDAECLEQIVQISNGSPSFEIKYGKKIEGQVMKSAKHLQCKKYLEDWEKTVADEKKFELAEHIDTCSKQNLYSGEDLRENQKIVDAASQFYKQAVIARKSNSIDDVNSKSKDTNVTDGKCCKYFTIVSCIIIIVIVVVILFSENDEEEEEENEEDEENPNTPAEIEESLSQDLGNSESIKHAIDNMNVVHKENKVDQIASSHEKIDVDGLVDVNATVEEVHVSE